MSIQELEAQALRLPRDQQAALAQHLIASLEEADETEQAWAEEAGRRSGAPASGEAVYIPAEDVLADARRIIS